MVNLLVNFPVWILSSLKRTKCFGKRVEEKNKSVIFLLEPLGLYDLAYGEIKICQLSDKQFLAYKMTFLLVSKIGNGSLKTDYISSSPTFSDENMGEKLKEELFCVLTFPIYFLKI